jgi:hypothetical protein
MAQASKSFLALVLGGILLVGGPLAESLGAQDGKRSQSDNLCPGAGGGTHVIKLAIHLGTIPLGGTEKAVGIFYEFSTKEIPRANGFSITTGISTLSCQVSGMDLDYSGPPRVPQVPQTNRSPKSDSQSSSGQGSAPIAR